jgi:hypothetical protein
MQYLCLIYQDESALQNRSKAEIDGMYAEYVDFAEDIKKAGRFVGSNRLQPARSAATVRVRDGNVVATDGPYAETKEQLGGYYLIGGPGLERGDPDRSAHSFGALRQRRGEAGLGHADISVFLAVDLVRRRTTSQ